MKLEKYLADYMESEIRGLDVNHSNLVEIIKQGLDAFESTEDVKIWVKPIPEQCLDCPHRNNCDGWDEKPPIDSGIGQEN